MLFREAKTIWKSETFNRKPRFVEQNLKFLKFSKFSYQKLFTEAFHESFWKHMKFWSFFIKALTFET